MLKKVACLCTALCMVFLNFEFSFYPFNNNSFIGLPGGTIGYTLAS